MTDTMVNIKVPVGCRLVKIVRLHDEGHTNTEIARRVKVSFPIVSHLLNSIGRKANHSLEVNRRHEEILRLRKEGYSYRAIGNIVGLTFQAAFNCCKKHGLTTARRETAEPDGEGV